MTRSSSSVARRAHIASHRQPLVVRDNASDEALTSLGDHSIVVDASTAGTAAEGTASTGGIRNSTINLTSISNGNKKRESTLSSFSRVVRSLFGRQASDAGATEVPALPLTYARADARAAAAGTTPETSPRANNPKRRTRQKRAGKKSPATKGHRQRARHFGKHPRPTAGTAPAVTARLVVRNVKRGGANVVATSANAAADNLAAQASAYSAAVAALPESTPTAAAVVAAADSTPSAAAYVAAAVTRPDAAESSNPYNGSAARAVHGSYGNAAAARARGFRSQTIPVSGPASAPVPTASVSVDAHGVTWVAMPTGVRASSDSRPASTSSSAGSTPLNPKAAIAVKLAPTGSVAASSSALRTTTSPAAVATATASRASAALPTSPPPSTVTASNWARRA